MASIKPPASFFWYEHGVPARASPCAQHCHLDLHISLHERRRQVLSWQSSRPLSQAPGLHLESGSLTMSPQRLARTLQQSKDLCTMTRFILSDGVCGKKPAHIVLQAERTTANKSVFVTKRKPRLLLKSQQIPQSRTTCAALHWRNITHVALGTSLRRERLHAYALDNFHQSSTRRTAGNGLHCNALITRASRGSTTFPKVGQWRSSCKLDPAESWNFVGHTRRGHVVALERAILPCFENPTILPD